MTRYVYGTATGKITPEVYRNDLLRAVIYPDSDDTTSLGNGTDGVYDRVEYVYNRLGEGTEVKDQNGTIHAFVYDGLGRQTQDRVTTVGTGVDDAVRRIARTYEVRGMVQQITSYDDPDVGEGSVLNDLVREYDTIGRLTKEYQEHEGAKDANTLYVEYAYAALATALRPTSVRYPNGRHVYFDYSGTHDGNLNRLTAILDNDGSTVLSQYTWLGLGTMVVEDFAQPDVKLDYFGGATGTYAGFDNFGRVVDQKWYDYGASAVRDQYTYGYDRASNRLYRENTAPSGKDEYYTYDGMYQLLNFDRGDLNANKDAITGTPGREEDFTLDPTGNWAGYVQKTSGTTDLSQSRDHNEVNEITDVTETQGTAWITPAQDKAGNMTTLPKPSSLADGLTCTYDVWNRLVEVEDATAEVAVARYEYDGTGRRIKRHLDTQSPADPDGIDAYEHYFHAGVQVVETRETDTENDQPETLQPVYQYVWSARYIDAPILRDQNTDQDSLCDDARVYYLTDGNMNVTSLVDTAGDGIERYVYDPYGQATVYDGTWSNTRSSSSYGNGVLFTGRERDAETGLMYYRSRYYHAHLGRFTSRDSIAFAAGDVNLLRYVRNRPTVALDPSGLVEFEVTKMLDFADEHLQRDDECYFVSIFGGTTQVRFKVDAKAVDQLHGDPVGFLKAVRDKLPQSLKDALDGRGSAYEMETSPVEFARHVGDQLAKAAEDALKPGVDIPGAQLLEDRLTGEMKALDIPPLVADAGIAAAAGGAYFAGRELGGAKAILGDVPGAQFALDRDFKVYGHTWDLGKVLGDDWSCAKFTVCLRYNAWKGEPSLYTVVVVPFKWGIHKGALSFEAYRKSNEEIGVGARVELERY